MLLPSHWWKGTGRGSASIVLGIRLVVNCPPRMVNRLAFWMRPRKVLGIPANEYT